MSIIQKRVIHHKHSKLKGLVLFVNTHNNDKTNKKSYRPGDSGLALKPSMLKEI